MNDITAVGIDLAKKIFRIHAVNARGKRILGRNLTRKQLPEFMAQLPSCLVGLEACSGAHYWARLFREMGHNVRLIPPQYVKPYVKTNKNDAADAEAICEAVQRENMRFVPIKELWQQELQSLHRVRSQLLSSKVAFENAFHGLLAEYGILLPETESVFLARLAELLAPDGEELGERARFALRALFEGFQRVREQIALVTEKLQAIAQEHEDCRRLQTIPGVGPLSATALIASLGNASQFQNGRQLAAWLGLVPRQHSSGGKTVLLGISKRGDPYLRCLLIHGARAVLRYVNAENPSRLNQWLWEKKQTRGVNRATVALANKNARAIWVILTKKETYRHVYPAVA